MEELLTRPSYYGLARELREVADVCHARGVPLIIDEAQITEMLSRFSRALDDTEQWLVNAT